jgi:hypothetical protein
MDERKVATTRVSWVSETEHVVLVFGQRAGSTPLHPAKKSKLPAVAGGSPWPAPGLGSSRHPGRFGPPGLATNHADQVDADPSKIRA